MKISQIKNIKIKSNQFRIFKYLLLVLIFNNINLLSKGDSLLTITPKKGDGINILLQRYNLSTNKNSVEVFKSLNKENIDKNDNLILNKKYILPIKVLNYNGINIRSSINNNDRTYAEKIKEYNLLILKKGLKKNFKIDKSIWLPLEVNLNDTFIDEVNKDANNILVVKKESKLNLIDSLIKNDSIIIDSKKIKNKKKAKAEKKGIVLEPLLGNEYEEVKILSNKLNGITFYLDAGHGGVDPGAVGVSNNTEMHEDEYAYDVTIRLARKLLENGADVYMIVQDKDDGIRDSKYLNNKFDETYYGDIPITMENKLRLRTRANIVNELYSKNEFNNKKHQLVTIHVDSRISDKRIDIFFYYQNKNLRTKTTANTLLNTIESKYNKAQPGRGYQGSVTSRNLYMLNNCMPPAVYIELGNIQNPLDQVRFIEVNNRQAIANWLCDGFIKDNK